MNLFCVFGIGSARILEKGCNVTGTVTAVRNSGLYVIKKPVRLYPNENNTRFSHFVAFRYTVNGATYEGKLFLTPHIRCPQKGERIEVFYDPEKPEMYACHSFGPAALPMGW